MSVLIWHWCIICACDDRRKWSCPVLCLSLCPTVDSSHWFLWCYQPRPFLSLLQYPFSFFFLDLEGWHYLLRTHRIFSFTEGWHDITLASRSAHTWPEMKFMYSPRTSEDDPGAEKKNHASPDYMFHTGNHVSRYLWYFTGWRPVSMSLWSSRSPGKKEASCFNQWLKSLSWTNPTLSPPQWLSTSPWLVSPDPSIKSCTRLQQCGSKAEEM